jgi:hypothetical protein
MCEVELHDLGRFQSRHSESPVLLFRSLAPLSPFRANEGVCPSQRVLASHCVTSWGLRLRQMAQALRPRGSVLAMKLWSLVLGLELPTLFCLWVLVGLVLQGFSSFGRVVVSGPWLVLYG